MPHGDMRARRRSRPFLPERAIISEIGPEPVDIADMRIVSQPPRSPLAAPVERRDRPALVMPVMKGLEIFLEDVAAAALEQNRSTRRDRGGRPVEAAQLPAVRGGPERYRAAVGIGSARCF